jgi:ATP-dependent RNA helicase DDX47/RRP3
MASAARGEAEAAGGDGATSGDAGAAAPTFSGLGVCEELAEACAALKWKTPTPIQHEALPPALAGNDVIGLAETGSGKTGAYAIPILQELLKTADKKSKVGFALVVLPTRELADQVAETFLALGARIGVKVTVLVGGVDMAEQAIALGKQPHIIVGTPGRVLDHLQHTRGFKLSSLRFLVLDEADRLLDMEFEKEINLILEAIPRERRTFLFSATMTTKVEKLQRASLRKGAVRVQVSRRYKTVDTLVQQYMFLPAKFKDCYLAFVLNELAGKSVMVFVASRRDAHRISLMLRHLGFPAIPLHGNLTQQQRRGALNSFKSGQRGVLVATDVASRGLDIPLVDVVVNYDIPQNSKDYVHRVGRTARAGRSGRAISLVTQYDVEFFQRIEKLVFAEDAKKKRMDEFHAEEALVMVLLERVQEAQRLASLELREIEEKRSGKRRTRDADEDAAAAGGGDDGDGEGGDGEKPRARAAGGRGGGGGGRGGKRRRFG